MLKQSISIHINNSKRNLPIEPTIPIRPVVCPVYQNTLAITIFSKFISLEQHYSDLFNRMNIVHLKGFSEYHLFNNRIRFILNVSG